MSPQVKKGIFITIGLAVLIVVGIALYNTFKAPVDDTPQEFNKLIEKAKNKHPSLYTWWESLSVEKQINIESGMTSEILTYLDKEFSKGQLSADVKSKLAKYGYVA